jgi:hypothetical protein
MKAAKFSILILMTGFFFIFNSCNTQLNKKVENRTVSFDGDWLFIKDNPAGAETPAFDDSQWRKIDLPHDWSIEDLPGQTPDNIIGPFSKAAIGKMGTGYTIGGTAWYRKHFIISKEDMNKTAYLMFDGVYMNSDVWINGKHVGEHPYGEISGQGKLAATGNGNPQDMASFKQPLRKTYHGVCLAIVSPAATPGKINIKATAVGLNESSVEVAIR